MTATLTMTQDGLAARRHRLLQRSQQLSDRRSPLAAQAAEAEEHRLPVPPRIAAPLAEIEAELAEVGRELDAIHEAEREAFRRERLGQAVPAAAPVPDPTAGALAARRRELQQEAAALEARRPSLSLPAALGNADARRELDALDARLAELRQDLERIGVAEGEAARQAAAERDRQAAEHRRQLEAAYVQAEADHRAALADVEAAIIALVEQARRAEAAGAELDRLITALGRPPVAAQHGGRRAVVRRFYGAIGSQLGWPGLVPGGGTTEPLATREETVS